MNNDSSSRSLPPPIPHKRQEPPPIPKVNRASASRTSASDSHFAPSPKQKRRSLAALMLGGIAVLVIGVLIYMVLNRPPQHADNRNQDQKLAQVAVTQPRFEPPPAATVPCVTPLVVSPQPPQPVPATQIVSTPSSQPTDLPPVNAPPLQNHQSRNLLKMIDAQLDAVHGHWRLDERGNLTSAAEPGARIELPYSPPEEYDLKACVTIKEGEQFGLICVGGQRQFHAVIGAFKNKAGLEDIGGKGIKSNPTTITVSGWPQLNKRHEIVVQVRKGGISVSLDRKGIVDWKTDYKDVSLTWDGYALTHKNTLGITSWACKCVIDTLEVTEVTGEGKMLDRQ